VAQVALRVEINAEHTFVMAQSETDGQILRNGGFTGAALLIYKG
jgi:hypothetical protein